MANGGGSRSQLAGQGRRVVELVSAERHDAQLLAEVVPSRIVWSTLGHDDGHDVCVSEPPESVAVPQHLAKAETELSLFVLVGDALDFGDEDRSVRLPSEVVVRPLGQPGAGFDSRRPQDSGELVRGVCVALEAALDLLPLLLLGRKRAPPGAALPEQAAGGLVDVFPQLAAAGSLAGAAGGASDGRLRSDRHWAPHTVKPRSPPCRGNGSRSPSIRAERLPAWAALSCSRTARTSSARLRSWARVSDWRRGDGAVQVEPPAGLGAGDLEPAACFAPVGEPDGRTFGDATGGARPVRRSFTKGRLKCTKTETSLRAVPLQAIAVGAIDRQSASPHNPLLFPAERGGYLDLHNFRNREWKAAQRAAGIERLRRVYDLRHTFATCALRAGISTIELSRYLGASLTMIARHYGHLARDGREHAIRPLDGLSDGQRPRSTRV